MACQPHDPPQDALLEGLAAGREDAFAALYDAYALRLFAAACRMLGSQGEAEDAVQDIFVGLVRAGGRLRRVRDLRAYLFASLRHAAVQRRRRQGAAALDAAEALADPSPAPGAAGLATASPWRAGAAGDVESRLEQALRRLPPEQRQAVALHIDGGLTFAQVAEVTGVSPNTAASRYRYALERLRDALRHEGA
ncbi:MAG: sigma-70 family RNA polymerase sigma factor [Planctomycetes bacterium]|nr:sigma-70 family RNA polymerase sigma factor [Planctomycetota bacterium]